MSAVAEVIVFPDVEDLLRVWLTAQLPALVPDVRVDAGRLPKTLPDKHVFVRRTGGVARDLVVDVPRVTFESRARTSTGAERLAAAVRALVGSLGRLGVLGDVPCYEVREISGPYLDPDPVNPGLHRYSASFELAVRGTAA